MRPAIRISGRVFPLSAGRHWRSPCRCGRSVQPRYRAGFESRALSWRRSGRTARPAAALRRGLCGSLTSEMITRAPSLIKRSAQARPMPCDAPVMTVTVFFNMGKSRLWLPVAVYLISRLISRAGFPGLFGMVAMAIRAGPARAASRRFFRGCACDPKSARLTIRLRRPGRRAAPGGRF